MAEDGAKDFDAWRKQRNEVPIRFILGGEEFAIPRRLSAVGFFDFTKTVQRLQDRVDAVTAEDEIPSIDDSLNWTFLKGVMPLVDYERILEVCRKEAIDSDTIGALVDFIISESTGRPTESPSDSPGSSSTSGVNTKGDLSSATSQSKTSQQEKPSPSHTPSESRNGTLKREKSSTTI